MSINLEKETKKISGKYIYIDDAKKDYIQNISIDTNIKQDSREGYNLCDIQNSSYTTNVKKVEVTPKYIILEQIDMNSLATIRVGSMNLKAGVTYTIKRIVEKLSGSTNDTDIGNIELYLGTKWKKVLIAPNVTTSKTFTVEEDGVYSLALKVAQNNVSSFTDKVKVKFSELMVYEGTTDKPYEQYGSMPSIEFPSEIKTPVGKQEVVVGNMNYWKQKELGYISNNDGSVTSGAGLISDFIPIPNDATFVYFYGSNLSSSMNNSFANRVGFYDVNKKWLGNQTKNAISKISIYGGAKYIKASFSEVIENPMIAFSETAYTPHQSQVQDLDLTSELLGTIVDKEDGSYFENRYERYVVTGDEGWGLFENNKRIDLYKSVFKKTNSNNQYCNYFKKCEEYALSPHSFYISQNVCRFYNDWNFTTNDEINAKFKELYNSGIPIEVVYELATPTYTKLTDEQQEQWNKIKKMHTYEGVTNIYTINENGISPVINLEYTTKYAEEYDFYIDENARFIVPEYDINYQVSIPESDLSDMPEASETAVKIAGKDGDLVLNTTYAPQAFNVVAYTDDNLEPKEKEAEKTKLTSFLHSIKNKTKNFGLLYRDKFYPVKYNDKLTPTIYPKSIRFEIPIKSSKSLGYALEKKMIFGNGKEISNTIEETGCKIIIEGPIYGTNDSPMVITLNDYQMAYYNTVLEGNRLEIDTNNSTIKHISSNGEVTNVAAYYNHEYPKIKYGENEIKILSKIDNETQVYTEWYDLKI